LRHSRQNTGGNSEICRFAQIRMALAEDAEDIKAIRERVSEQNLDTNDTSRLAI